MFPLILLLVLPTINVSADVANPEFATKHCKSGEKEITASYSSKEAFGPRTYDETKKYANNPNYYELTGSGSSFGGQVKYCQRGSDSSDFKVKLISLGVGSVVFVAVVGIVWLRRRGTRR